LSLAQRTPDLFAASFRRTRRQTKRRAEDVDSRHHHPPSTVGPYILEGSKPGAAAACWLTHRMIPPDRDGYGELMRASLLTAREFYERLVHWFFTKAIVASV
jgi:hypothetical protein